MPHLPDETWSFRWLKAQVSVEQVLQAYGLQDRLRLHGATLVGPCPLHGGDHPTAFRAHLTRNIWHCFTACGGGDVVDLIRHVEHCSHAQAACHLRRLALDAPRRSRRPPRTPRAPVSRPGWRPFRRQIPLDPCTPFLQLRKRITPATARHFEAGWTAHCRFLHRTIAVRLHDIEGHPLGYAGRRLDPLSIQRWGKWRFPRQLPKAELLYNAHRAAPVRDRGIVLVECPWSVMRVHQAGWPGVVALLGTSMSDVQQTWLAQAPVVLLLLDGDEAGRTAARRLRARCSRTTRVTIEDLPDGMDPDDLSDLDILQRLQRHLLFP